MKKDISNFGTMIMKEAKKMRKLHPNKEWTVCIKVASKKLKDKGKFKK